MKTYLSCLLTVFFCVSVFADLDDTNSIFLSEESLRDKLHGAWAGTLIGGLEGLVHEFKYNEAPREDLPDFNLSISGGARTDDDNDFELTHLYYMGQLNVLKIPYEKVVEIWKLNINEGIWNANKIARDLMDEGVVPPATSDPARNSFASFNLSAQFAVEMYGAIAPGLPEASAEIGVHYANIAVSGEPLHAARYWTALISLAGVHQGTLEELVRDALAYIDPQSAHAEVVQDAIEAFKAKPDDWKAARQAHYTKWLVEKKWDKNATTTNGGLVILALLYGQDDFYKSIQYGMAMGLDADCNAAAVGTVLGMRHGYKKLARQYNFDIGNTFINETRPGLPAEMTIDEQLDLFMRVSKRVILQHGGKKESVDGKPGFRIPR